MGAASALLPTLIQGFSPLFVIQLGLTQRRIRSTGAGLISDPPSIKNSFPTRSDHLNSIQTVKLGLTTRRTISTRRSAAASGGESWESNDNDNNDDDADLYSSNDDDESAPLQEEVDDSNEASQKLVEEYEKWIQAVNKAVKSLQKKEKSLRSEMQKAEQVQGYTARADLLKSNLWMFTPGVKTATVQDWEHDGASIELTLDDSYQSATDEVEALYQQVRKLKRGTQVVGPLLEKTRAALESLVEMKGDLEAACSAGDDEVRVDKNLLRLMQDRLIRSSRLTGFSPPFQDDQSSSRNRRNDKQRQRKPQIGTPASNIRKLQSDAGCTILVGRNRRGNEHISLSIARGDDVWMHARGTPGAHVLIQQRRGGPTATDDCLKLAANLAAFYSDARGEFKVEVTLAEPKHVQKPRGAPLGAVKLREEQRVLLGKPQDVPNELKEARAVSGLSDEYRKADKAKLRKLNRQQVAKQKQKAKQKAKKKRQEKKEAENFY